MDRVAHSGDEPSRFRLLLPRSNNNKGASSESAPKPAQSQAPGRVSPQHSFTDPRHSGLHGDAGATYLQGHTESSRTYAESDSYPNNFLHNVETHFPSGWIPQSAPSFGAQADQYDPFKSIPHIGMGPDVSSYEDVMQLPFGGSSFASPQNPWAGPSFTYGREDYTMANIYGELGGSQMYPNFISRSTDAPVQRHPFGPNSLALADNRREAFRQVNPSFPERTMSHESAQLGIDVNKNDDFWDFLEIHNNENWQSFPSESAEANDKTLGVPFENRLTDDDINDFSMFFDTYPSTERLEPNLTADALGIPEDSGAVSKNEELPFSQNHESDSNGPLPSPNTLQASDSGSSPTLTKVSSHQSSVTLPLEYSISTRGIESGLPQSEDEEACSSTTLEESQRFVDLSSKEDDLSVIQARFRIVLPLLPPPADFSHTNIVVKAPVVRSSIVDEKYLKVASEAKQYGESKLATALPALTILPLDMPSLNQKRARSSSEDLADISDNETRKVLEEAESGVVTPPSTELVSSSAFSRKKRGKLSLQERVSRARIRRLGACLRCGILKEKCSGSVPCERCVEVSRSRQTSLIIPCWRSKLGDIELFRRRTQHGLFVYTYTKQSDILYARSVRIFDPEKLRQSSRGQVPLTCQNELAIESLRPLKYLDNHLLLHRDQNGCLLQYACTVKQLEKGKVITSYLDRQMRSVLTALGTSHQFVHLTLDIAERYSQSPERKMLRNSLRIFTARFLRRKFWVSTPHEESYDVAWMDVPWRAMPVLPPKTFGEAETLNKILKDYLFGVEKSVIRDFKTKIYARNRADWFELFLVTFIFQVVLSEKLEMSFYSKVKGVDSALEMPWSTFGGLRSYSSQAIAAHFRAIKGSMPFQLSRRGRAALGKLGDLENNYLDACPRVLKDAMLKKDDLGSRRSSSSGHGGTPGSWWQWAIETVLDSDAPD